MQTDFTSRQLQLTFSRPQKWRIDQVERAMHTWCVRFFKTLSVGLGIEPGPTASKPGTQPIEITNRWFAPLSVRQLTLYLSADGLFMSYRVPPIATDRFLN